MRRIITKVRASQVIWQAGLAFEYVTSAVGVLALQLVDAVVGVAGAMALADLPRAYRAISRDDHSMGALGTVALSIHSISIRGAVHLGLLFTLHERR